MNSIFRVLFLPLEPIVNHPERAFLVAGLFAVLLATSLLRSRQLIARYHVVMLLAFVAWILFGWIEQMAVASGWNIRVDLLVSAPLVLTLSIAAIWAGFCDAFRARDELRQRRASLPLRKEESEGVG